MITNMEPTKRYSVTTLWNYRGTPQEQYERCIIAPLAEDKQDYEGDSSMNSYSGIECFVRYSLEEAIVTANFNPSAIEFSGLTEEELKQKDEILSHYTWSYEHGLQKKSE